MQSWGGRSRFADRDTQAEPTKSGICGLLGCALGRPRGSDFTDLAALKMAIRVDAQGRLAGDFHTAGGAYEKERYMSKAGSTTTHQTAVIGTRDYLEDAMFTVALAGDSALVAAAAKAVDAPHWPLSLGRRSFAPVDPVLLGVLDGDDPVTALRAQVPRFFQESMYRIVFDDLHGVAHTVADSPRRALDRTYSTRSVTHKVVECTGVVAADGYKARQLLAAEALRYGETA